MKTFALILLFLCAPAFAGQTPPPGSNGQLIYNNSGQYGAENPSSVATESSTGIASSSFALRFSTVLDAVADCGVIENSSADQSTALQSCEAQAISQGLPMIMPPGTVYGNVIITGDHFAMDCRNGPLGGCTLKMPAGKNTTVIQTQNFATLVGGSTLGTGFFYLHNMTIDGNSANNTSGDCFDYYGYTPAWQNDSFDNCPVYGMYPDWGSGATPLNGMEGYVNHIRIDTTGQHGLYFGGPHDTQWDDLIVIDAGRSTANTYDGVHIINGRGNIHMANSHIWQRVPGMAWALNDDSGGYNMAFLGCWFEYGSNGSARVTSNNSLFDAGTRFTLQGNTSAVPGVLILGGGDAFLGQVAGAPGAGQVGYKIGDSTHTPLSTFIAGTVLDTPGGAIYFYADGGGTTINLSTFDAGSYPFWSGDFAYALDTINIIAGSGYYSYQGNVINAGGTVSYGNSYTGLLTDGSLQRYAIQYINNNGGQALTEGSNDAYGNGIWALKSRNYPSSNVAVQTNDNLFTLHTQGADGTVPGIAAADIAMDVDGSVTTSVVPGRIRFSTATTAGTMTEAMRITDAQRVGIGTTMPLSPLSVSGLGSSSPGTGGGYACVDSKGDFYVKSTCP